MFLQNDDLPPSYDEAMFGCAKFHIQKQKPNAPPLSELSDLPESPRSAASVSYGWANLVRDNVDSELSTHAPPSFEQIEQASLQQTTSNDLTYDTHCLKIALRTKKADILIKILCCRPIEERNIIFANYNKTEGTFLDQDILTQFNNHPDFAALMLGMIVPLQEYLAWTVYRSQSYKWMCFIMTVLPNEFLTTMKFWFKRGKSNKH